MARTWHRLLRRVLWLEYILWHKQPRWPLLIFNLQPWRVVYHLPNLFLLSYFNSHIVSGGEHTHRRFTRSHLGRLPISPMFLLPLVHQALCTCFSLMMPEMEGYISSSTVGNSRTAFVDIFWRTLLFRNQTNKLLGSIIPGSKAITDALDPANHHVIHNVSSAETKR